MIRFSLLLLIFSIYSSAAFAQADWFKSSKKSLLKKQHISLVFAYQNLSSAATMFGHTILLFHNNYPPEPEAIAVEYLGNTRDSKWSYAKAALWTIQGYFKQTAFHYKQREYDSENRDLWVYTLDVKPSVKQKIVLEAKSLLKKKYFPYNFFGRNCSFYITKLLLNAIGEDYSFFPFVNPISTVRRIEKSIPIKSRHYFPSSRRAIDNSLSNLDADQKNQLNLFLRGYSQKIDQKTKYAASKILNFKIPREPDSKKRKLYYQLKKSSLVQEQLQAKTVAKDPLTNIHPALARFSYDPFRNQSFLYFAPVQRNFFNSVDDGLSTSYLGILNSQISFRRKRIKLDRLKLFHMDSFQEASYLGKSFNRTLELSYYDWSYLLDPVLESKEYTLRFGSGVSFGFHKMKFALIPYIGLRNYSIGEGYSLGFDSGFKFFINHFLMEKFRYEILFQQYFFSPLEFNYILNVKAIFYKMDNWQLSGNFELLDKNYAFKRKSFALSYRF